MRVRDVTPPGGVSFGRIDDRRGLLATVDALQRRGEEQPGGFAAQDQYYAAALDMITSPATKRAFELEREDPRLRERYGRTRFGQAFRGFRAEAAGAAGDESGFSRQIKEFAHVSHGGSV